MATTTITEGTIEIESIAADWDMLVSGGLTNYKSAANIAAGKRGDNTDWSDGPRTNYIQFNPGAADDKLVIKQRTAAGAVIFEASSTDANDQQRAYYYGKRQLPYIDYSECTLSAGHKVIIGLGTGGGRE